MSWKGIPGYEHLYEISEGGEVRSLNYNKTGEIRVLKIGYSRDYAAIELAGKRFTIHRLVALTFIGPRPDGYQINHKDGNKLNNHVDNLEYCTPSENQKHSFVMGLQCNKGEQHSRNKLTDEKVRAIRKMREMEMSQRLIAGIFNVDQSAVSNILRGKSWSHVQ